MTWHSSGQEFKNSMICLTLDLHVKKPTQNKTVRVAEDKSAPSPTCQIWCHSCLL